MENVNIVKPAIRIIDTREAAVHEIRGARGRRVRVAWPESWREVEDQSRLDAETREPLYHMRLHKGPMLMRSAFVTELHLSEEEMYDLTPDESLATLRRVIEEQRRRSDLLRISLVTEPRYGDFPSVLLVERGGPGCRELTLGVTLAAYAPHFTRLTDSGAWSDWHEPEHVDLSPLAPDVAAANR